jgi:hypothetical protein
MKMTNLYIGASGSATQVNTTATQLNYLSGLTAGIDSNLATGTSANHDTLASAKAIKTYVDDTRTGLEVKDSCVAASVGNLTLSGTQTVDGIALSAGDRVLVKDQGGGSSHAANGIYVVASGTWSRATDADTAAEFNSGVFFFVEQGTVNADSGWVMTTDGTITIDTTAVEFAQFSGAGQITAGVGLTKNGNTLAVDVGSSTDSTGIEIDSNVLRIDTDWTGASANLTSLGTVTAGTWNATPISATYGGMGWDTSSSTGVGIVTSGTWTTPAQLTVGFGGTGASTFTSNGILYGNAAGAIQDTAAGTAGYFLYSNAGTPDWTNVVDGGTF